MSTDLGFCLPIWQSVITFLLLNVVSFGNILKLNLYMFYYINVAYSSIYFLLGYQVLDCLFFKEKFLITVIKAVRAVTLYSKNYHGPINRHVLFTAGSIHILDYYNWLQ